MSVSPLNSQHTRWQSQNLIWLNNDVITPKRWDCKNKTQREREILMNEEIKLGDKAEERNWDKRKKFQCFSTKEDNCSSVFN